MAIVLHAGACGDPAAPDGGLDDDPVEPGMTEVTSVAAGERHTCAVTELGRAFCWGLNDMGQLGVGDWGAAAEPRPRPVIQDFETVESLSLGSGHSCALSGTREIWCWGGDGRRALGYMTSDSMETCGSTPCSPFPRSVIDGTRFRSLATGNGYTCAATSMGTLYCWGDNRLGQGGSGGFSDLIAYAWPVTGQDLYREVRAGRAHTCAVSMSGTTRCWGDDSHGQLGVAAPCAKGSQKPRCPTPMAVAEDTVFVALALGEGHSCGLTGDGRAFCWGDGSHGALGDGGWDDQGAPVEVASEVRFTELAAGGRHTCGLSDAGRILCWGGNDRHQLGREGEDSSVPEPTETSLVFKDVAAGGVHTCAVTMDGVVYCWGGNGSGQLGDGTVSDRNTPVAVAAAGGT